MNLFKLNLTLTTTDMLDGSKDDNQYGNYHSLLDFNSTDNFQQLDEILFELSSEQRLLILSKIFENNTVNLSTLSRLLNIPVQEAHRNLNRLSEAELIQRNSSGDFYITSFGKIILVHLFSLNFISKNKLYFKEHKIENIPLKFLQRIGILSFSSFLKNSVSVYENIKIICKESEEYIHCAIPMIQSYMIDLFYPKIQNNNIKFQYVLPHQAAVPKSMHNENKHEFFHDLISKGIIQRKMTKEINTAIILNEKKALVMFSNGNGNIDMNSAFFSENNIFHEWCEDYFEFIWQHSKYYDKNRLEEV
jgi:predicted transcriptional regulator